MIKKGYGQAYVPTQDEYKRLLKIVQHNKYANRDSLLVLFSYGLGLRAVEMAALKIRDVIGSDGKVLEVISLKRTKGNKTREAYVMDPRIRKSIVDYMAWRQDYAARKRLVLSENQAFFLSQKGAHFTNVTLQKLFTRIYHEAGFRGRSHSGRRTFATNLIEKNIDIRTVQVLMGHSNISETIKYVQSNPERLKKAIINALY
jgi:integrase/recombinase XerD